MRLRIVLSRLVITALLCLPSLPLCAQPEGRRVLGYAGDYASCADAKSRLRMANDFFAYLYTTKYIDEPISFPAGAHIDSVDVNVYYYVAEWCYGEGDYHSAIDYCTRATKCMGVVDAVSKSDVYGLLGAVYFRMGTFDKAAEALHQCYELDKATGDFDRMSSTLNGIASVFVAAGKPQEAEKYILEAIGANSFTDNLARRAVLFGITSEIYRSLNDMEQSLSYATKALDIERMRGDSAGIGIRLSQLAGAQLGMRQIAPARRSLEEAMPLLLRCGNLRSWGICQNQMGDILASEDQQEEAAAYYREAAMLFLRLGDGYNELHAREGLYKATKASSPSEAMMHLERAKLLHDSIYQQATGEALGKYNAIYYNDILQAEKERAEHRSRVVMVIAAGVALAVLLLIALATVLAYRCHQKSVRSYEQHISTMHDQNERISRQYQNVVAGTMQTPATLTDDDRYFLDELASVIEAQTEKGITDIETIATQMHINTVTLRRRLSQTVALTPSAYMLKVRMHKARRLLLNYRDMTIAEVAEKCGYSLVPNFTRAFTRYYGIKPSDVRTQKGGEGPADDNVS